MAPVPNHRVLFNSIPEGYPEPGKTTVLDKTQSIDLENVPLHGGILIKTLVLSVDPFMRGRMRPKHVESYVPAFILGEPLIGHGVGIVVRSEAEDIKKGDYIFTPLTSHQEYYIRPNSARLKVIKNEHNLPWSAFAGVLGMPGQTAYYGWKEYSQAKKGEVAFVSAGAGPVGSLVIQLAKRDGLKVIASAGSEDKLNYMKELGADVVFNYKTTDTSEILAKEGPIDIYWDAVAGPTLDAALEGAANYARFIMCGAISGYNEEPYGVKNVHHIFGKSLTLSGFVVFRLEHKWGAEFDRVMPDLVAEGAIKYREDLTQGIENVGESLLSVLKGTNKGKAAVIVADG